MYKQYLEHLELSPPDELSLDFLQQLVYQHTLIVPWENFELQFNDKIELGLEALISRYVDERLGGLCYQLSSTFCGLLDHLGFEATLVPARLLGFGTKIYEQPRNTHIVPLVKFKGQYVLCDVSWLGLQQALLLEPDMQGSYSIEASANPELPYTLYLHEDDQTYPQYEFGREVVTKAWVQGCLDYNDASLEREAAHHTIIARATEMGRVSIVDEEVKIVENQKTTIKHVDDYGGFEPAVSTLITSDFQY